MFLHMSVILSTVKGGGAGLCMMSLPVWMPDPMFLLIGVSISGPMFHPGGGGGVSVPGPTQMSSLQNHNLLTWHHIL